MTKRRTKFVTNDRKIHTKAIFPSNTKQKANTMKRKNKKERKYEE